MGELEQEREPGRRAASQPAPAQEVAGGDAERLASLVGNQGMAALARPGGGILPDGRAHPALESALARTRGGGRELDAASRDALGQGLGDPLSDVRVHADAEADALAQSVSAHAFTTGSDVYFAAGEYEPGSSGGQRLLAHELTHVVQQRGATSSGPLAVSQPGDAAEVEAEAAADELAG